MAPVIATGYQGGALARRLREISWNVHATTRNLSSAAAIALKDMGVHLNECDWDNAAALKDSIKGCDKLFLCLMPDWDDPSRELRQCQIILQIAKEAGVKQVVSSTTLGVSQLDANVRVYPGSFMEKHMLNKKAIEKAVEDHGFEYFTFLRPTFFMANFLKPKVKRYSEICDHRRWTTAMTNETQLPILDHVDIAKFAVAAFQDPVTFYGRAIGLASDQMRVQEILDLLGEAAGQPGSIRAIFLTDEETEAQDDGTSFASTHKVLRTASDYVDLDLLRAIAPLTTFKDFLKREKEAVKQTYT
ncbi:putative NmrA-like family domain-containing protein 1 [Glarea lozoyensis 74030]|uniref:Putative NmrA-like family domain-containing protein 1 n=1 Tax=Glarea lozoyensis (strain ATCC 74030 / MF5533) TaxID=1104152 RepID=H0EHS0_GLAL7|nr:putative NmrA-like family domain-containing protein 1 [Glarea lozoyensis 74030]